MNAMITEAIREITASQQKLVQLFESVAGDQDWIPSPGEWSFRCIAAHMATVDRECYQDRIVRIARGEYPRFGVYLNTGRDFTRLDLRDSMTSWKSTRQEIFAYLQTLPEEAFSYTGAHPMFGDLTIQRVLEGMLDHDRGHLVHLKSIVREFKNGS